MSVVYHCCVLSCPNDSASGKIFVPVPSMDESRRRKWIEEIGRPTTVVEADLYCCEDHFYFPEDCDNYELWLTEGGRLRLKENVIPRFNLRKGRPFYSRFPQCLLTTLNKWCFIPSCETVANAPPYKILFPVPEDLEIRKFWFYAIRRTPKPGALFCCEDHFDFTTDIVDFHEYLTSGCTLEKIHLKNGVVPHLNLIHRLFPCGNEKRWDELRNGVKAVQSENEKKLNFEVELIKMPRIPILTENDWEKYLKSARAKAANKSWFERHKTRLIEEAKSENYGGYSGIKIVQSKHGGDLLVYLGYTFCQSHVQKCGRMRWRCSGRTRKFCMSQLITEADKVTPIPGTMKLTHNHPPVFPEKNAAILREKIEKDVDFEEPSTFAHGHLEPETKPENPRLLFLLSLNSDLREMSDVQFNTFKQGISKIIAEVG